MAEEKKVGGIVAFGLYFISIVLAAYFTSLFISFYSNFIVPQISGFISPLLATLKRTGIFLPSLFGNPGSAVIFGIGMFIFLLTAFRSACSHIHAILETLRATVFRATPLRYGWEVVSRAAAENIELAQEVTKDVENFGQKVYDTLNVIFSGSFSAFEYTIFGLVIFLITNYFFQAVPVLSSFSYGSINFIAIFLTILVTAILYKSIPKRLLLRLTSSGEVRKEVDFVIICALAELLFLLTFLEPTSNLSLFFWVVFLPGIIGTSALFRFLFFSFIENPQKTNIVFLLLSLIVMPLLIVIFSHLPNAINIKFNLDPNSLVFLSVLFELLLSLIAISIYEDKLSGTTNVENIKTRNWIRKIKFVILGLFIGALFLLILPFQPFQSISYSIKLFIRFIIDLAGSILLVYESLLYLVLMFFIFWNVIIGYFLGSFLKDYSDYFKSKYETLAEVLSKRTGSVFRVVLFLFMALTIPTIILFSVYGFLGELTPVFFAVLIMILINSSLVGFLFFPFLEDFTIAMFTSLKRRLWYIVSISAFMIISFILNILFNIPTNLLGKYHFFSPSGIITLLSYFLLLVSALMIVLVFILVILSFLRGSFYFSFAFSKTVLNTISKLFSSTLGKIIGKDTSKLFENIRIKEVRGNILSMVNILVEFFIVYAVFIFCVILAVSALIEKVVPVTIYLLIFCSLVMFLLVILTLDGIGFVFQGKIARVEDIVRNGLVIFFALLLIVPSSVGLRAYYTFSAIGYAFQSTVLSRFGVQVKAPVAESMERKTGLTGILGVVFKVLSGDTSALEQLLSGGVEEVAEEEKVVEKKRGVHKEFSYKLILYQPKVIEEAYKGMKRIYVTVKSTPDNKLLYVDDVEIPLLISFSYDAPVNFQKELAIYMCAPSCYLENISSVKINEDFYYNEEKYDNSILFVSTQAIYYNTFEKFFDFCKKVYPTKEEGLKLIGGRTITLRGLEIPINLIIANKSEIERNLKETNVKNAAFLADTTMYYYKILFQLGIDGYCIIPFIYLWSENASAEIYTYLGPRFVWYKFFGLELQKALNNIMEQFESITYVTKAEVMPRLIVSSYETFLLKKFGEKVKSTFFNLPEEILKVQTLSRDRLKELVKKIKNNPIVILLDIISKPIGESVTLEGFDNLDYSYVIPLNSIKLYLRKDFGKCIDIPEIGIYSDFECNELNENYYICTIKKSLLNDREFLERLSESGLYLINVNGKYYLFVGKIAQKGVFLSTNKNPFRCFVLPVVYYDLNKYLLEGDEDAYNSAIEWIKEHLGTEETPKFYTFPIRAELQYSILLTTNIKVPLLFYYPYLEVK